MKLILAYSEADGKLKDGFGYPGTTDYVPLSNLYIPNASENPIHPEVVDYYASKGLKGEPYKASPLYAKPIVIKAQEKDFPQWEKLNKDPLDTDYPELFVMDGVHRVKAAEKNGKKEVEVKFDAKWNYVAGQEVDAEQLEITWEEVWENSKKNHTGEISTPAIPEMKKRMQGLVFTKEHIPAPKTDGTYPTRYSADKLMFQASSDLPFKPTAKEVLEVANYVRSPTLKEQLTALVGEVCLAAQDEFPKAGSTVDGRKVGSTISNLGSISATLTDWEELPGIREISMSDWEADPHKLFYSKSDIDRCKKLAAEIEHSKRIDPLIVVKDKDGLYVLEGGHRLGALHILKAKSFPALVVIDTEDKAVEAKTILKGLEAEAAKYKTFEEFKKAFSVDIKHGLYWHVTADPDFKIDTAKGPRDMSSMSNGKPSPGKLMITSHLEYWTEYYGKDRPYAAEIDMSEVDPKDYQQVARGFGNEFWVENPAKAKVVKVYKVQQALRRNAQYHSKLPNSDKELRQLFDKVHPSLVTADLRVQPKEADSAPAPESLKKLVYYHGTDTQAKADKIWKEGIRPDLADYEGLGRPVAGRVYITSDIIYASHYALGSNTAGQHLHPSYIERLGRYGYILVIPGTALKEVDPDEDHVGEAVYKKAFPWLTEMADKHLSKVNPVGRLKDNDDDNDEGEWGVDYFYRNLMEDVESGNYDAFIKAGKVLLPYLNNKQKIAIIKKFGNIAHEGALHPTEMWRIDRKKTQELKTDGSNFFKVAEKVHVR